MAKLIWGADLYKGFKLDKNNLLGGSIGDLLPFQMLSLEEKTIDWIKAVADFYETAGWLNVEKKAGNIQRNYMMRYGKLNQSDYIINPSPQEMASINMFVSHNESTSPLEQFYSLAPTFVDVLRGEFIKRDNTWTIEAIDPWSTSSAFDDKKQKFEEILTQFAESQKTQTLASMGITEQSSPQQYQQEMQSAMKQLNEVELKSKNFRTTGVKWAEKVINIHEKRYNLNELEPDGFESGLITDSEFWHIDLLEDDFKVELLNPKWCDYHKGPNVKYVSDGDYFLWFDFMSTGDIVNKFGRRIKEEDILKLKDIYVRTTNIMIPDYLKAQQGSYYDLSKNWTEATDLNPAMNDTLLGKELAYNYMRSPNFDHNIDVDIFNPVFGRNVTGHPQMFRVMRLYWRSLSKIGWLTKIDRDGSREEPTWVDENFIVTVEPEYDNTIVKSKTKDNLLYGEHIDWTWRPEWRHSIKISPNQKHTFWLNNNNQLSSIYIDGAPVRFQFKGRNNPFDSLPPVEGCIFSHINSNGHSFIDRMKSLQILYNICMNKVPKKFLKDYGNKLAFDTRLVSTNSTNNKTGILDPIEEYEDRLMNSDVLPYKFSRETLEGMGQPALPHVLQLTTIQEAMFYLDAAEKIKWMAGENVGITRQRVGGQKASETATGINQGIAYSETQTEKYYEQHSNLMQRFRQRMLDAAQYYSTFQESSKEIYMNEMDENVFLEIEGTENLLPHYNINLQSKANVRSALQTISGFLLNENTLPIAPSAKIEALVSNSIPKILSLIKKSELDQQQIEAKNAQDEYDQKQTAMENERAMEAANLEHQDKQKELDRQSQENIATIRAFGGLQSDINKNGVIDSSETLTPFLKQQEIISKQRQAKDALDQKKQLDTDKMLLERDKNQTALEKEKIKGEYNLKIAQENKNRFDKK